MNLSALFSLLTGCTQLKQYRTDYQPCATAGNQPCTLTAIEEGKDYLLSFVEFDDHGWLWDPNQMHAVVNRLYAEDAKQGLLIIVFAHGWKHNAAFDDLNVAGIRTVLSEMQKVEAVHSAQTSRPARKVVGVYLGWRGLSQQLPLVKELTFWERKRTAHVVGQGAVAEVLVELDTLRKASRIQHKNDTGRAPTMLVVVGHSFGGAVVYSSLAPFLEERLIDTLDNEGQKQLPRGFGDLVVLVNPAFEAARFEVLKRSSDERSFGTNQPATIAIFTSTADWATGLAFPAGRFFSTIFEKNRHDQPQWLPNIEAVGHYGPYTTHDLKFVRPPAAGATIGKSPKIQSKNYRGEQTIQQSATAVEAVRTKVHRTRSKPKTEVTTEDATYHFSESDLIPTKNHKPHDPVYVVAVDPKIIPNHDDFETQAFLTFLREFILAFTVNQ